MWGASVEKEEEASQRALRDTGRGGQGVTQSKTLARLLMVSSTFPFRDGDNEAQKLRWPD